MRAWVALGLLAVMLGAATASAQTRGRPGEFDYYLLSLSWSPAFCARQDEGASPEQCGADKRFGFIIHGLWPQHDSGGYPERCASSRRVPEAVVDAMMPVMPSVPLITHQWRKHGTCSGLDVEEYFARTRAAFAGITVPPDLAEPAEGLALSASEVEARFVQANPGLKPEMIAMICSRNAVTEVRLCLDRELKPRPCGSDVIDRCGRRAVLSVPGR
ncbi:ribonuclease T2 family protein [Azospirillum halopraeferens]|uniref:ribonuclease T2 family protein n=1 Tax=Azospirillum halopraeferens TaxID=34010 RepID=UPI0004069E0F|nr:ribonuclease T [Azospirillum halopraeferens]